MNMYDPTQHYPVLLNEIITAAQELKKPVTRIFDGTFGRGGHSVSLLKQFPQAQVFAFDRDKDAIDYAHQHYASLLDQGRLHIQQKDYRDFDVNEMGLFDFMLLDLGVSSPQLDQAERGFSFYQDGPLDMRMDKNQTLSAATIINEYPEEELLRVFKQLGEVQKPFRVVRAVINDRKTKPFLRTQEISSLIERVDGWRVKGHHPATKYFMALRLEVNKELEGVQEGVEKLISGLTDSGRLAVISFHSLEDRIVKHLMRDQVGVGFCVNRRVIIATDEELKINTRSRSAKLRVFEKGTPPAKNKYPKKWNEDSDESYEAENRAEDKADDEGDV